jgi:hypothetical protein
MHDQWQHAIKRLSSPQILERHNLAQQKSKQKLKTEIMADPRYHKQIKELYSPLGLSRKHEMINFYIFYSPRYSQKGLVVALSS